MDSFQFTSLADFFWMNGHGPYVWVCYAVTFGVLIFLMVLPSRQKKLFFKQQRAIEARKDTASGD